MDNIITYEVEGIKIYFSKEAYNNWQNAKNGIRRHLDKHINYLIDITKAVVNEFANVDGFYVSSTWRPNDKNSPHFSGRGFDVSRVYINGKPHFLKDTYKKLKEWTLFKNKVYELFDNGCYNQIISPFGLKDVRPDLDKDKKEALIKSHSDHFHLNIPEK